MTDTSDWELLHRAAHTIKGSMRYFGAHAVFDRAFGLEQLAAERHRIVAGYDGRVTDSLILAPWEALPDATTFKKWLRQKSS
jgi:HPt (histidine-containing phosphotransfer) domain-containing protein